MREIKFRAWDNLHKYMSNVTMLDFASWNVSYEREGKIYFNGDRNSFRNEDTDRCDIMQCTGLKDKNGKEIYEGDIVGVKLMDNVESKGYYICKTKVVFHQGCWILFQIGFDYSKTKLFEMSFLYDQNDQIEIIGNIHENPELIKE